MMMYMYILKKKCESEIGVVECASGRMPNFHTKGSNSRAVTDFGTVFFCSPLSSISRFVAVVCCACVTEDSVSR